MAVALQATDSLDESLLAALCGALPSALLVAAILRTLHRRSLRKRGLLSQVTGKSAAETVTVRQPIDQVHERALAAVEALERAKLKRS